MSYIFMNCVHDAVQCVMSIFMCHTFHTQDILVQIMGHTGMVLESFSDLGLSRTTYSFSLNDLSGDPGSHPGSTMG